MPDASLPFSHIYGNMPAAGQKLLHPFLQAAYCLSESNFSRANTTITYFDDWLKKDRFYNRKTISNRMTAIKEGVLVLLYLIEIDIVLQLTIYPGMTTKTFGMNSI